MVIVNVHSGQVSIEESLVGLRESPRVHCLEGLKLIHLNITVMQVPGVDKQEWFAMELDGPKDLVIGSVVGTRSKGKRKVEWSPLRWWCGKAAFHLARGSPRVLGGR